MPLGLLALVPPPPRLLPYHDPLAGMARRVRLVPLGTRNGDREEMGIRVDGHPLGSTVAGATFYPVRCDVPGSVAGTYAGNVSGAYTFLVRTSFVALPGYRKDFGAASIQAVNRDGTILLGALDDPGGGIDPYEYKSPPGKAWTLRRGRRREVGPAESFALDPDGTVWGYALRRPDGAYCGAAYPYADARPIAFAWRAGVRRSLGEWVPTERGSGGTLVGYLLPPGKPTLGNDETPAAWVRLRGGRLERLGLAGLSSVEAVHPRGDGSLLSVVRRASERDLFVLRGGRAEAVPRVVAGRRMDWRTLQVDRDGTVSAEESESRRWRVVLR